MFFSPKLTEFNQASIFYEGLKFLIEKGRVSMGADLYFDGSVYRLLVRNPKIQGYYLLHSERSKKPRVFRSADTALKVCNKLGFEQITVMMGKYDD